MDFSLIHQLQEKLRSQIYLVEDPIDLFYLTGLKLSKGSLLIADEFFLYVDGRYESVARSSFGSKVKNLENLKTDLENQTEEVFFDPEKTLYARYLELKKSLDKKLKPLANPLKDLQVIKSSLEIEKMRKSAQINRDAISFAFTLLEEGVKEIEIAKEYEIFCLKNGAEKLSFEPIIAFGPNSALPHHRASDEKLKPGDIVLMDVGCFYHGYASDMTRTTFFQQANPKLFEIREFLIKLQKNLCRQVKPGVSTLFLAEEARKAIQSYGNFPILHSLGHGIGLSVHEFPRLSSKKSDEILLKPGMVITIEPGIYIEGVGGFREEDTVLVTEEGHYNFYKNFCFDSVKF